MVTEIELARHVSDALHSFYNTRVLQTSPLVELLLPTPFPGPGAVQVLRQKLREAIGALKPADVVPFGSTDWLDYRVLWTRYIQGHSQADTCRDLGISSSTYYRHHNQAMEAVTHILWVGRAGRVSAPPDAPPLADPGTALLEEAAKLVQAARRQPVYLQDFLHDAQRTIQPLAEKEGVCLAVRTDDPTAMIYVDPGLLSEIVLAALSEAIAVAGGGRLVLEVTRHEDEVDWRIGPLDPARAAHRDTPTGGLALPQALLSVHGGRLWFDHTRQGVDLILSLPLVTQNRVLVIDDDADMERLCRLYLPGYVVSGAHSAGELEHLLDDALPDLVLLDILMPQWDGWSILRQLRDDPRSAEIPVVVCSVLAEPRLALALGANRVLHKPITQEALQRTVEELLSPGDSPG